MFVSKLQEYLRLLNEDFKHIAIFLHTPVQVYPGVKNRRYSISKVSETEFTISISDITLEDGGNYTCSQYDTHISEKTVEVTVLGEYNRPGHR